MKILCAVSCSGVVKDSLKCLMLSSQLKERVKQLLCLVLQIIAREILSQVIMKFKMVHPEVA